MSDTPIAPGAGSLGLAPKFQGVGLGVLTDIGSMSFSGLTPDMYAPKVGSLAFTGLTPSVAGRVPSPNGVLAFTGLAPTLSQNPQAIPVTGALVFTGQQPGLALNGPIRLSLITGYGAAEESPAIHGSAILQFMTATGIEIQPNSASGAALLEKITGVGYGPVYGAASLRAITATGRQGNYITGSGILLPVGIPGGRSSGYAVLEYMGASGFLQAALVEVYQTKAMNTRSGAVTEYQNFNFNSYAFINGAFYGAGTSGLYLLDGSDDNGSDINWSFKTGQLDDKTALLKRLPEIVVGLRASGPIRVRVWKDDNTYFDYMLPSTDPQNIHQQRVQPGKGMRSRYFMVELQGVANSAAEIDSLQPNFSKTTRRIG